MKVQVTLIILSKVAHKIDDLAIEGAIEKLPSCSSLQKFTTISAGIIVRGDNAYPEEHYSIGDTLYIALQFDPEQILSHSIEAVTKMICKKFESYLSTITAIEERPYTMMIK